MDIDSFLIFPSRGSPRARHRQNLVTFCHILGMQISKQLHVNRSELISSYFSVIWTFLYFLILENLV